MSLIIFLVVWIAYGAILGQFSKKEPTIKIWRFVLAGVLMYVFGSLSELIGI